MIVTLSIALGLSVLLNLFYYLACKGWYKAYHDKSKQYREAKSESHKFYLVAKEHQTRLLLVADSMTEGHNEETSTLRLLNQHLNNAHLKIKDKTL